MKKKLLSLVLALVLTLGMTTTALAEEITIFESSENGTLDADAIAAMQANTDATFVLEYNVGGDGTIGWGLGGLCFAGWTVDSSFEAKQVATNTVEKSEWSVSDILAKGTEINVNFYNDATPVKAYLVTADAAAADTDAVDASPATGDTTPVVLVFGIMILAMGAVVITARKKAHC